MTRSEQREWAHMAAVRIPSPWTYPLATPFARRYRDQTLIRKTAIFGPAATKWYGILTKHVNLQSKNGTILARVACDQFLFAPVNMGTSFPLS
jgi:hypothetical protein